jgi:hypothetical protein
LRKSVLINESVVGKSSRIAVDVIRGTKLPIDGARIAAGDAVPVLGPGPPHCVAHRNVECVWHKHIASLSHRHIENLTATRWDAAHRWLAVLICNMDGVGGGLFLVPCANVFVTRSGLRRKHRRKRRCQQKGES